MKEQKYCIKISKFYPSHIFECGQCFRWKKLGEEDYIGVFGKNVLRVKKEKDNIIFEGICEGKIENVVNKYFDMETDYEDIKQTLKKVDEYLATSIEFGSGIRILNQDLWEVIISFIISANNNIPRIQKIIEKISKEYGNEIKLNGIPYYTFPTKEQLRNATIEDLRRLGLGFRDKYVYETTKKIASGEINLSELEKEKDINKVREILESLPRNRTKSCRLYFAIWYA